MKRTRITLLADDRRRRGRRGACGVHRCLPSCRRHWVRGFPPTATCLPDRTLCAVLSRGLSRAFWTGFVVFGCAMMATFAWGLCFPFQRSAVTDAWESYGDFAMGLIEARPIEPLLRTDADVDAAMAVAWLSRNWPQHALGKSSSFWECSSCDRSSACVCAWGRRRASMTVSARQAFERSAPSRQAEFPSDRESRVGHAVGDAHPNGTPFSAARRVTATPVGLPMRRGFGASLGRFLSPSDRVLSWFDELEIQLCREVR